MQNVIVPLCEGITGYETKETSVYVFPNPAREFVIIKNEAYAEITLYNSLGAKLNEISFENGEHQVSLKPYPDGIYILKAKSNGTVQTFRLIKTE